PDLVYRFGGLELRTPDSLRQRLSAPGRDGGNLGDPDRCSPRVWHFLPHLFRSHRKKESRPTALGFTAVLCRWTVDGVSRRRLSVPLHRRTLGVLPPREAALWFHGALQEEERRPRARG